MDTKPPLPPFTRESAIEKVRMAEDAWNSRDPDRVVLVYSEDTRWRNRNEFPVGRPEVHALLTRKWAKELEYRLIKELWAWSENRIAVRFAYECRDASGQWFRSYGNENWAFNEQGSWSVDTRVSTIWESPTHNASFTGHWVVVRTIMRA